MVRSTIGGRNSAAGLLMLAAVIFLPACAAQIVSRTQQAVNATQNTADAVVASCGAPALTDGLNPQTAPDPTLPPDQQAAQQAAIDCRDAATAVQDAQFTYTDGKIDKELAQLSQQRHLLQEYKSIGDAIFTETNFLLYLRQQFQRDLPASSRNPSSKIRPVSDVALIIPEVSNAARNLARLVRALATASDNGSDGLGAALRNLADQLEWEADHPSTETLNTANGPLLFPNVDKIMGLATDALNKLGGPSERMAGIDAREKYIVEIRADFKANLQGALNRARAATLAADAQAQKCGGQPITTRIPGYSETFWEISS